MKNSCGAILYTILDDGVYIILGREGKDYFHFKGVQKKKESLEETAIREIYEETRGIVKLSEIKLECFIQSRKKRYFYALVFVNVKIIEEFNRKKNDNIHIHAKFKEKEELRLFKLSNIFKYKLHNMTIRPILFFYEKLKNINTNFYSDH